MAILKVPDAMANSLDLVFDADKSMLQASKNNTLPRHYLDTLIYGVSGNILQIIGMHSELLEC